MKAALAEPTIVARMGQPVSVTRPISDGTTLRERGEVTGDVTRFNRAASHWKSETRSMEFCSTVGVSDKEALKHRR